MNIHHQSKLHFSHEITPLLYRGFDAEQEDLSKEKIAFQNDLSDESAYIMMFDISLGYIKS